MFILFNKRMCKEYPKSKLTLSGPEGGGGGSEAQMTKLTADNQKPLTL